MLVYPRGELLHMSGALVFAAAAQGIPLDYLAPVARGDLCSWVPWDCNNQRQFLAGYQPQGTVQTAD